MGEQIGPDTDLATLRKLCDAAGIPYVTHWDAGAVVLEGIATRLRLDTGSWNWTRVPEVGLVLNGAPAGDQRKATGHTTGRSTSGSGVMNCVRPCSY